MISCEEFQSLLKGDVLNMSFETAEKMAEHHKACAACREPMDRVTERFRQTDPERYELATKLAEQKAQEHAFNRLHQEAKKFEEAATGDCKRFLDMSHKHPLEYPFEDRQFGIQHANTCESCKKQMAIWFDKVANINPMAALWAMIEGSKVKSEHRKEAGKRQSEVKKLTGTEETGR